LQVHPFAPGHFVVGGAWVGRIDAIEHNLTIAFDNGMVVRVRCASGLVSGAPDRVRLAANGLWRNLLGV
jgi:hypothetical protein